MNEEAVELGKKQLQEGLTYDQAVFLFLKQTSGVVEDTVQIFKDEKDEFGAVEQSKLPKVEEELHYFFCSHLIIGGRKALPIHRSKNTSWRRCYFIIWISALAMMHKGGQRGTLCKNDSLSMV
ncbi:MAG: hypothetical protein IMY88_04850 [Chloroflexi bacterium]|nr:hypothetical protein [Chloroflexota bacterium]